MITLVGSRTKLEVSPTVWTMSLEMARLSGWNPAVMQPAAVPAGHLSEEDDLLKSLDWRMRYLVSEGQTVASHDAAAFATALEIAITGAAGTIDDLRTGRRELPEPLRTPVNGFSFFTTPMGRDQLRMLVRFAKHGAFQIH